MGSPYHVHEFDRVHVIRTARGFSNLLSVLVKRVAPELSTQSLEVVFTETSRIWDGPEGPLFNSIFSCFGRAILHKRRTALFLEARYEWKGWEEFQRSIIFDFSGEDREGLSTELALGRDGVQPWLRAAISRVFFAQCYAPSLSKASEEGLTAANTLLLSAELKRP